MKPLLFYLTIASTLIISMVAMPATIMAQTVPNPPIESGEQTQPGEGQDGGTDNEGGGNEEQDTGSERETSSNSEIGSEDESTAGDSVSSAEPTSLPKTGASANRAAGFTSLALSGLVIVGVFLSRILRRDP
jgi:hypothetical protein